MRILNSQEHRNIDARETRNILIERNGANIIEATEPIHTIGKTISPITLTMGDLGAISKFTDKNGEGSPGK
jgi:hypothetical protein